MKKKDEIQFWKEQNKFLKEQHTKDSRHIHELETGLKEIETVYLAVIQQFVETCGIPEYGSDGSLIGKYVVLDPPMVDAGRKLITTKREVYVGLDKKMKYRYELVPR